MYNSAFNYWRLCAASYLLSDVKKYAVRTIKYTVRTNAQLEPSGNLVYHWSSVPNKSRETE